MEKTFVVMARREGCACHAVWPVLRVAFRRCHLAAQLFSVNAVELMLRSITTLLLKT